MQAGDRLGHFEIRRQLGAGGMGEVYLAEDTRLGRAVAIKILPAEVARDESRRARFAREARAASALSHPNIAHIYDVGDHDGIHFIAMEYVEGPNLGEHLAAAALDQDKIVTIALQVAGALDEARGKGIIHRDIKPANIALTARGEVKVLDFGLAKITAAPEQDPDDPTLTLSRTAEGTVLGTVRYMSPEQALGKEVDTRSDLFSLGVVLYEMVAGRPPFAGASAAATLDAIVHRAPEALARFDYGLSPELERIILKLLEKDPDNRYQTPRDLLVDLRNLQRTSASGITGATNTAARSARRRNRGLAIVLGVVTVAALGTAAYLLVPGARADVQALAVLPFENETGDPEIDYLCDGVTESLINTLSQVPDLKVISSRSAFAMRGRAADPGTAGRELGVDAVLFGRVVQRDDEITISTELVHTRDNHQLWGERYRRPVSEIQAVENEITSTIAKTLRMRLADGGSDLVNRHATDDPEAYRLYLKGREYTTGTKREMDKAIDYFQDAIARDPGYALAHAGLAQCYTTQSYLRGAERDERVELARAAARKALELDPELAEGHTALGMIKMMFDLDWRGAKADLQKGLALGPNSVPSIVAYGDYLLFTGRYDEAMVHYRRAMELDPLSIGACHDLAITHMVRREYELSETYFRKAIDLNPNWTWGYVKLAMTLGHMGRCAEALAAAAQAEELLAGSGTPATRAWLDYTYAKCGETERARAGLADLRSRSGAESVDPEIYACVHLALGEVDQALTAMEQSLAERSPNLVYIKASPDLFMVELADEPRFQALVRAIGFD